MPECRCFHAKSKRRLWLFQLRVKAENCMKNAVLCRFLCPESHLFHALFYHSQKGVGVRSRGFHPSRGGFSRIKVAFSCIRNTKIAIKNAQNGGFWGQKGENTKVFLPDAVFASIDYQCVTGIFFVFLYFCVYWLVPRLYIYY